MSYDTLVNLPISSSLIRDKPLPELLTIVVVTSPIAINPSTELLDRLLSSLAAKLVGFQNESMHCPVIVAADGIEIGERKRTRIFGRATETEAVNYVAYLNRLRVRFRRCFAVLLFSIMHLQSI